MKLSHLTALALSLCIPPSLSAAQSLTIEVNIPEAEAMGNIRAGLFMNADSFASGTYLMGVSVPARAGMNLVILPDVPAGTYGLSLYIDQNENEVLDRNLLNIPVEPYGFSNDPRIGMRAPDFATFAFTHTSKDTSLRVTLNGL